jgi:hypothetical protein
MKPVRKLRVRSRLSRLAFGGEGIRVREALMNAQAAFEAAQAPFLVEVDRYLQEIQDGFGPAAAGREARDLEDLYSLSSRIIDVSHCLPGSGIDKAAWALCALTDALDQRGVKDWPAIDVHIRALSLLRGAGGSLPEEAKASILEGLAKLTLKRAGETAAGLARSDASAEPPALARSAG